MMNYVKLVDEALLDPIALARANELMADAAYDHYRRNHDRKNGGLRVSDAGACVRQTWADIHGKLDLPENPRGLRKMRDGSRTGVELACLIKAGIERWYAPLTARLEVELEYNGIPGHADVVVYAEPDAIEVVECKRTGGYWDPTKAAHDLVTPETKAPWYIWQACAYAQAVKAETFVVLVDTFQSRNEDLRQFRYYTDEWRLPTQADYDRLSAALFDDAPEGDATEDFRCRSCRMSDCPRNDNPARIVEERSLIVDLDRSIKELV